MNTTWKRLPEIISASKKSNLKLKRSFFKKLTICLFSIFFIEIKIESRLFYIDIIDYHRILLGYFKECYELKQQILYFMNFISYSEGCLIEFAIYFQILLFSWVILENVRSKEASFIFCEFNFLLERSLNTISASIEDSKTFQIRF